MSDANATGQHPHRPPADNEEVFYEGNPSLKGEVGMLLICAGIDLVLMVVGVWIAVATGGMGWLVVPVAMGIGAGVIGYPVLLNRSRRYKITNYRIDYERGILSKNIDTLELWHVEDIRFHQSLWDRILQVGTLTIVSDDDNTPTLEMRGLPEPRKLFDVLKQRVISVKRQRGVLKLDT